MRRDRLVFVRNAVQANGGIVAFPLGRRLTYLVSDPGDVRHVLSKNAGNYRKGIGINEAGLLFGDGLLSSEGALWQDQRSCLQPAFHPAHLERFSGFVAASVDSTIARWRLRGANAPAVDIAAEMNRLALCVAGKALFGVDLEAQAAQIVSDLELVGDWAMRRTVALLPLPPWLSMALRRPVRAALQRINRVAAEIAEQIDRRGQCQDPIFASLLSGIRHSRLSRDEADRRIRDEIVTFLVAGHETTAATVSWAWFLLCTHPDAMETLRTELRAVLNGRSVSWQHLTRLTYTRMVVDETMRLYPPVWMITRRAILDDIVGGYRIKAGSDVLVSIYSLHRHPEFWSDHDAFKPERFENNLKLGANAAYWPFGVGPRACVAARFGAAEAMSIIASMALRVNFTLISQEVEPEPGLTLRPRGGVMAHITVVESLDRS
jgi:cytochrome P450